MSEYGKKSTGQLQSKTMTSSSKSGLNKANMTLWKSKYAQPTSEEEFKKVENNYIDNLKQQVYFMEMELKLLKEREKEIEKSGGFTQLFNDERDPTQHIMQLKSKYSNMRKNMEDKIEELTNTKRETTCINVSLKSKFETLKKFEKEIYDKVVFLDERSNLKISQLENEYMKVNKERLDLETSNRLDEMSLKNELQEHQALEFSLKRDEKIELFKIEDFSSQQAFLELAIKNKSKEFENMTNLVIELETKSQEEPVYKIELDKNIKNKKKIEILEQEMLRLSTEIEELEQVNEYLITKKERVVLDRKKFAQINEDLKREIESKNQLNDARIQKKVKDNNSDEIQKLENHSNSILNNIREYEQKLELETSKSREFSVEIIKLNIELRDKNEQRQHIVELVDFKLKEMDNYKEELEELTRKQNDIRDKLTKENIENTQLKAKNKMLSEQFASSFAKFNYISQNYDYNSNLKKISMDDMKTLTQTNTLVNESIGNFVTKIGSFKTQNLKKIYDDNF